MTLTLSRTLDDVLPAGPPEFHPLDGADGPTVPTHAVALSTNEKLGPNAAATYRGRASCPAWCPFLAAGCYAAGRIEGVALRLGATDPEYSKVRALASSAPYGGIVRFNVVGDVLDAVGEPDRAYLAAMSAVAIARPDVDAYTYTHAWQHPQLAPDAAPGVVINASCESIADLVAAAAAGWPTVVTDPGPDSPDTLIGQTVAGRFIVQCPQQTRDIPCSVCRLCVRPNRRSTVAFATHGSGARLAAAGIAARRALPVIHADPAAMADHGDLA